MQDTLQSQVAIAPQLYASEATYRPQYANLERGIMLENLGLDPTLGLLDAYRQVNIAQKDLQQDATQADIDMIRELGPQLAEAQRQADPEADALRQAIMADATEGLAAEGGMTAEEERMINQQVLEGAADRGMLEQASTLEDQISARLGANRQLKQQRLQNAASAYGLGNFDPLLALTGRTGNSPAMAQQGFGGAGFALNSSPGLFNPESAYSAGINTQNYQAEMDARTATAANRAGLMQGAMGMMGSLGSAAIGLCWVAREVYGSNNPAWLLFREWMLCDSPNWLFHLYRKHGERFANWISDKPRTKSIIRKWMDSKIRG
jgi:hypothetical protein